MFFEREPFNGKRGREQLRVRGAHTTTRETQRDSHEATGALNALRSIRKELGGVGLNTRVCLRTNHLMNMRKHWFPHHTNKTSW